MGGREGGQVAALSRRFPAESSTGDFDSKLLIAAEFLQRFFSAAPSLCRVQLSPRRGNGCRRWIVKGIESLSGFGST